MGCLKEGFVNSGIRECCRGANLVGGRGGGGGGEKVCEQGCLVCSMFTDWFGCTKYVVLADHGAQNHNSTDKCSLVTKGMKE